MKDTENITIKLSQLSKFYHPITSGISEEDFFISKVCTGHDFVDLKSPVKVEGYFALYCKKGRFVIEINMKEYEITEGTLLLYAPGNIINMSNSRIFEETEFVFAAMSREILQYAKMDFTKIYDEALLVMTTPCMKMTDEEKRICAGYYYLAENLMAANLPCLQASLLDLGSSLFHYLGSIWSLRIEKQEGLSGNTLRSKAMFERFIKLVAEHHTKEREVGFYAEKMNITPKYLSQLVKKNSGKSAPDWISSFVIMQAKNYLKYSNMDVKEIAFKLNFSSSPAFFRYFKAHTGQTPLDFRES